MCAEILSQRKDPTRAADGYFTVEASLVIPVVLCVILMLMYLSFYLYDRCILAQDCYVLSYRQSIEKGDADRAGEGAAREQFGQKLFMLHGLETGCSGGGTICVHASAAMETPVFQPDFLRGQRKWSLAAGEKARKTDPPKDYRRVRRLLHLAAAAGIGGTSDP